jgi:lipoprotein-releasing system permease protein
MPLSLLIANRFRQSQKTSGYMSFMSFSSIAGIGLGCFVLITLLSIMNGFERELTQKLLSVIPHGEIYSVSDKGIQNWRSLQRDIQSDERVSTVTPFTQITGLIQSKAQLKPVALSGIELTSANRQLLSLAVKPEAFERLAQSKYGVILGKAIAEELDVGVGDSLDLLIPQPDMQSVRITAPKRIKIEIVGLLSLGGEVDAKLGFVNLAMASEELDVIHGAKGLRVTLHDPFLAREVIRQYGYYFEQAVYMSDWTITHGHIFQDIQLVRTVVYIVLTLVIAVACFNVISTLVMAVKAKQSAIAILISMGATPQFIQRIFLIQGLTNGFIGTAIGTLLAVLMVPQLSSSIAWLERTLGVKMLSSDIYFIDFLPTEMQRGDIIVTVAIGMTLSVLASIYPARRAARVQPAEALH